jgi:predicted RNA-binding Zn-ribbon protein involved in translation (DUF1610 family)
MSPFKSKTTCGDCGAEISSPETNVAPCPNCGSKLRRLDISVARSALPHGGGFTVVVGDVTNERDSSQAFRYRKSYFKRDDETHHVYRYFDRLNDRYAEVTYKDETREVVRKVDEPLTKHQMRGSAKCSPKAKARKK